MSIDIQQMCGNGASASGGSGVQSPVRTWNHIGPDANGNINAKAADIGAALAGLNVQTVTKAYRQYVATEGHEDTTPMGYLWARGKGSRFLRAADGIHFVSCVDIAQSLRARLYVFIPSPPEREQEPEEEPEQDPEENGGLLLGASEDGEPEGPHISGGIYLNDLLLAGITSPDDLSRLIFLLGDSPIATAADIEAALAEYVTSQEMTDALKGKVTPTGARNIAKDEFIRTLPLTAVGSTWLQKERQDRRTVIRVGLGCNDWLIQNWNQFEKVELVLYICHRRHGLKYHWRHPLNWDETSPDPERNKYGYGAIAEMVRDEQHYPGEVFPPVPQWMAHGGYMTTRIKLKREDAKSGFYIIDPSVYFLNMLKPADTNKSFHADNIEFIGTQPRTNTARRHLPIMCTWGIEIDGKPLGAPKNTLRVGLMRTGGTKLISDMSAGAPMYRRISNLYLKVD